MRLSVQVLVAAGCTGGSDDDSGGASEARFDRGHVEPSCGPADGEAWLFVMGTATDGCDVDLVEGQEFLRLAIWDEGEFPVVAGGTYTVGSHWYYPDGDPSEYVSGSGGGTLDIEAWTKGVGARGRVDLTLDDGASLSGDFVLGWCETEPTCG